MCGKSHPGKPVWVFGDNLQVHVQIDIIKYALDRQVELWFIPAHSSHFLQPLDAAAPFAKLKRHIATASYASVFSSHLTGTSEQRTFASLAYEAEILALTPADR